MESGNHKDGTQNSGGSSSSEVPFRFQTSGTLRNPESVKTWEFSVQGNRETVNQKNSRISESAKNPMEASRIGRIMDLILEPEDDLEKNRNRNQNRNQLFSEKDVGSPVIDQVSE